MALANTFDTGSEAACGANASTASASRALRPRMRSTTRRAFIGVTRTYRARAIARDGSCPAVAPAWLRASMRCYLFFFTVLLSDVFVAIVDLLLATPGAPVVLDVAPERAGRRELTELVSDHGLSDEHRDVLAPVVHRNRVTDHVRNDRGAARPGSDHLLGVGLVVPFHLIRPALPQLMLACSALPTSPTVARHRTSTLRISPEGIRNCPYGPSLATSCTRAPADRAILAPPPGRSSIACTTVPTGMLRSGRLLPGLMSALGPFSTVSPCRSLSGAM